jgi:signal transduction histidine kinase
MEVVGTSTAWEALRARPVRYLVSRWPLRALAYVSSGVPIGLFAVVWLPVSVVLGAVALTPLAIGPLAALERRRLALLGGPPVADPHVAPAGPGLWAWLRARYAEAATWRELAYAVLLATVLLAVDAAAMLLAVVVPAVGIAIAVFDTFVKHIPAAVVLIVVAALLLPVVGAYAVSLVAVGHGEIARLLLGPGQEATVRVLTQSQARLVDAFEVERKRIERDLHDGAQQRLVALSMTLGLAELERDDPAAVQALVAQAAAQSRAALDELRDLVRGIHPQVLTDLGLLAAVAELTQGCGLPLTIDLDLPGRLPPAVESAAYFVVAEAVTNLVKHAAATRGWITGAVDGGRLVVEVGDDGVGGADPAHGTGLAGLADRVNALSGTLTVHSPIGGPTTLRLELRCSA